MTSAQVVLRLGEAIEAVELGPNSILFPVASEDGGTFSVTDFRMAPPPAPGPPPHIHDDADECVYVLDGTLEMSVGERTIVGGPGSVMLAPRGSIHSLVNAGSDTARIIVVLSPSGFEGYWREMAELRATLGGPPDAATSEVLQEKYHVRMTELRNFE